MTTQDLEQWEAIAKRIQADLDQLEDLLKQKRKVMIMHLESVQNHPMREITEAVAEAFNVSVAALMGKRKPEHISTPRQVAAALIFEVVSKTSLNSSDAARQTAKFFNRDRTTVLYSVTNVANKCSVDRRLAAKVEALRARFTPQTKSEAA